MDIKFVFAVMQGKDELVDVVNSCLVIQFLFF